MDTPTKTQYNSQAEVKAGFDELQKTMHKANEVASRAIKNDLKVEFKDYLDELHHKKLTDEEVKLIKKGNLYKAVTEETDKVIKKLDEKMDQLKAAINRGDMGAGGNADNPQDALLKQYYHQFNQYIRKGLNAKCVKDGSMDETIVNVSKMMSKDMVDNEENNDQAKLNNLILADFEFGDQKGMMMFSPFDLKALALKSFGQVGSQPNGGYYVLVERLSQIIGRDFLTSPVRQVANVISTANASVEMLVRDDQSQFGGWVNETTPRPVTDIAGTGRKKIDVHELYAQPSVTQQLIEDVSIDIGALMLEETIEILTQEENLAFVTGDGANKPQGFMNLPKWTVNTTGSSRGTYERNALDHILDGGTTPTKNGLLDLQMALLETHRPNARFAMSGVTWNAIRRLDDLEGRSLIQFEILKTDTSKILLGQSVIFFEDMDDPTTGNRPIAYGDFRKSYMIVDRLGMRTLRDELTDKPFVKFYTTKRVGGDVTSFQALKILELS